MSLMCHWTPRISKYLEISRIKLSLRVRVFAKPVHNRDAMMDVIQDVVSICFDFFRLFSFLQYYAVRHVRQFDMDSWRPFEIRRVSTLNHMLNSWGPRVRQLPCLCDQPIWVRSKEWVYRRIQKRQRIVKVLNLSSKGNWNFWRLGTFFSYCVPSFPICGVRMFTVLTVGSLPFAAWFFLRLGPMSAALSKCPWQLRCGLPFGCTACKAHAVYSIPIHSHEFLIYTLVVHLYDVSIQMCVCVWYINCIRCITTGNNSRITMHTRTIHISSHYHLISSLF